MITAGQILEEVTRTSIQLLLKEPYYAHFFSCLNKEVVAENSHFKTMAVGMRHRTHVLYVHPVFWSEVLTDKQHRYGVVKHEVLHILLKHTLVDAKNYHHHIMNIAMDIVVNQYIQRDHLPDEAIFLHTFPELALEPDNSWQYYYRKLMELKEQLGTTYAGSVAAANFQNIRENSHGLERHARWQEIWGLNDLDKSIINTDIDHLIVLANQKAGVKGWGQLPSYIKRLLEKIIHPGDPEVDWRRVLKLFSESSGKTWLKNTMKRPSRRYGTNPGMKVRKKQKLLIAVDTSGSVSKQELSAFFRELYHVYRSGAEIKVVECDAGIGRVWDYKGLYPEFVTGGGGTDFTPPIRYGNKEYMPDALIYFTDGHAPPPSEKARFPILWVISRDGLSNDDENFKKLPGRRVKMKTTNL